MHVDVAHTKVLHVWTIEYVMSAGTSRSFFPSCRQHFTKATEASASQGFEGPAMGT